MEGGGRKIRREEGREGGREGIELSFMYVLHVTSM